jgi:release factor glutamine methyltransferase
VPLADSRGFGTDAYEPAEDSELLADAAADRVDPDDRVVDVGTGTGYVAARVRAATGARTVGVDLNPNACRRASSGDYGAPVARDGDPEAPVRRGLEVVRGDLLTPVADDAADAVTFNPPYLPTDPDEERDDWLGTALSGGETGRAVIEPFVDAADRALAPGGRVLLLVSTLAGVDPVVGRAAAAGFEAETVAERSFPFETLVVLELRRT